MSWTERRTILVQMAVNEPGWGCVRLVHDRHIGRVLMIGRRIGPRWFRPGFYPAGTPDYQALGHFLGAKQRAATKALPK